MKAKYRKCRKKPIIVEFREVNGLSEIIRTREGRLIANASQDFIIRGVEGEEYPIKKEIFHKTYDVIDERIFVKVLKEDRLGME